MVMERGASSNNCGESSPLLPAHRHERQELLSSTWKSFGNILIAVVGAGVLGLPYTFKTTGWVAGIIMLGIVAALTYYCMMLLVWTKRKLENDGCLKWGALAMWPSL